MKRLLILLPVLAALACAEGAPLYTVSDAEFSAAPGSQAPNVVATKDGGALMSWWDRVEGRTYALRVAERTPDGWFDPVTVVQGSGFFVNWADFPSITELDDGTWLVHWLQKTAEDTYAYHVMMATSHDRGATWSEPFKPHRDDSPTEHGFVSVVPWGSGAAAVWLDGRQMTGGHGEGYADAGAMSIRFTTIGSDGSLGEDVLIDGRTCECCTTSMVATTSGLVAAYRDRSEEEIRDIAVVRFVDGAWTDPVYVGHDNWHYPGCPVNGPQLSVQGDTVAVAWFAAPENRARVQVAFSTDGGASFSDPIRVDDGTPRGRVDIEHVDDGSVVVSWLELVDPEAEVRARWVSARGDAGESWLVSPTAEARGSGFPRMTRVGEELVFAWTLLGETGGVRVASAQAY